MRILITGGSGFIGSHLIDTLSKFEDIECVNFDLKDGYDVRDYRRVYSAVSLNNPDVIIHLAALISVSESLEKAKEYFDTNLFGTWNVVRAAEALRVPKIIFASSAAVYSNKQNPYSMTKLLAEKLVEWFGGCGTVLRFFNIYGKGQNPAYSGVISKFIKNIEEGEDLHVYGDGSHTRDFIHVDDVVDAIISAIHTNISGEAIDIGTGKSISVMELIYELQAIYDKVFKVIHLPEIDEVAFSEADIRMAKRYLNFSSKLVLRDFLNETILGE